MIASRGVSSAELDRGADHFAQRARGEGPASKMMRFAAPLLDAVGDDHELKDRAFTFAMLFWNLALCEGNKREEMMARVLGIIGSAKDAGNEMAFRAMAADMIHRHRQMFPEMHQEPNDAAGAIPDQRRIRG